MYTIAIHNADSINAFRFIFGMADSAMFGSCMAMARCLFPDNFATAFSVIETSFGLGIGLGVSEASLSVPKYVGK